MEVQEARVIEVPIDNSNDVLEIDCSQLPSHAAEICDILENEGSSLRFYLLFALEYYKQGHIEEAITALKRGMGHAKANDQTAKVPLLNFLASIYVQKAKAAATLASSGDRDMLLQMATTLLTEAERINRSEPNVYLIKGLLAMTKRLPDAALQQFNMALRLDPHSLSAMLGKARVLFGKRQFQQALAMYQQILVAHPNGKPDARIGIGMCLQKLGHVQDARRALERAIEANPQSQAPHVLLATLDLNEVKALVDMRINPQGKPEDVREAAGKLLERAVQQLQKAFELQPTYAITLIRLADRLFYAGDYERARELGERALKTADTMAIQAEAYYQIARAHHAAQRFDLAYDAYHKCVGINEKHVLARFGLGQMQLHRADMSNAEATFQRVLERHPKCVEALRALGYLHARLPNTKAKALEYYEREMQVVADEAAESAKRTGVPITSLGEWFDDANLFLEAGLLYEAVSAKKARKSYTMAAEIVARTEDTAIPELWNNLGALRQMTDDDDELVFAEYDKAVDKCKATLQAADSDTQRLEATMVTITYNVARFYEHCGLWHKAEALYRKLVADVPTYIDARLRLAHILYKVYGKPEPALAQISSALEVDSKRIAAWLMRGNIELHRKNVQNARRAFEHVLKDISKHDIYALCSLGNFYLAAGRSELSRASADSQSSNKAHGATKKALDLATSNYKRAIEFFGKCLQVDSKCAAAAHGAAIAMAERGMAKDARVVFQDVKDAAASGLGSLPLCSPATDLVFKLAEPTGSTAPETGASADTPVGSDLVLWAGVNAAHSHLETGSFRQAVLSYEACIRRLLDTTAMLEGPPTSDSKFVVAGLEEAAASNPKAKNLADDPPNAHDAGRLTKMEASERRHTERDLRLYLVRALYVQAKATKNPDAMRAALKEIRKLCAVLNIDAGGDQNGKDKGKDELGNKDQDKEESKDKEIKGAAVSESAAPTNGESSTQAKPTASNGDSSARSKPKHAPEDTLVLFDLALVEQAVAQLVSDQPEESRTLSDIDTAADDLRDSTRIFTMLADAANTTPRSRQRLLYNPRMASERAAYGKSLATALTRKRDKQVEHERERQEQVEQWRKKKEEEETRRREEEERKERERIEKEARLLKDAEERTAALRREMVDAARVATESESTTTRTKRSRNKPEDDGFISDNDDLEAYSDKPRKPKTDEELYPDARPVSSSRGKKPRLLRGERKDRNRGPVEDDGLSPKKRRKAEPKDEDPGPNSKFKSKAIITDSDDDDDDDGGI